MVAISDASAELAELRREVAGVSLCPIISHGQGPPRPLISTTLPSYASCTRQCCARVHRTISARGYISRRCWPSGTRCGCRRPSTRRGMDGFENSAFMSLSELQQRIASLAFRLPKLKVSPGPRRDGQNTPSCGAAMSRDAASTHSVATISASADSSVVAGRSSLGPGTPRGSVGVADDRST